MTTLVRSATLVFLAVALGCSQVGTSPSEGGKNAPEIVGLDADGRAMHLSDYHGKVILLDFWFTDCPYCRLFEAQEKTLKKRYEDRPFVLLGVNTDPTRSQLLDTQKEGKLTWRSWWDGPDGPIVKQWRVRSFPTVYLIDHTGRIRHRWEGKPPPAELDAKLDPLVKEAEQLARAEGN